MRRRSSFILLLFFLPDRSYRTTKCIELIVSCVYTAPPSVFKTYCCASFDLKTDHERTATHAAGATRSDSGTLPGGASLVEVPAVGDWEKEVAGEVKGVNELWFPKPAAVVVHTYGGRTLL